MGFVSEIVKNVQDACKSTPIFVSVCLAQAILETGWGKASVGNNLFGIKATGPKTPYWDGQIQTVYTHEYINGVKTKVARTFRKYNSVEDSIRDHNYLFLKNKRYARVLLAKTPEAQASEIQAAGYATSPNYAKILISIIIKHHLKHYDL